MALDERVQATCILLLGISAILAGIRGYNMAWNNKTLTTSEYTFGSHATGLSGHTEYFEFSDNSRQTNVYPSLGIRYWESQFNEDLDGDCKIDRIRRQGGEIKSSSMRSLLVRSADYETNQTLFDTEDARLEQLAAKYGTPCKDSESS